MIGSGAFGSIYKGSVIDTGEPVGIKFEPSNTRMPQLMYECRIYKQLKGGPGIPNVYWSGVESGHNIMIMDLLDKSLESIKTAKKRTKFSLKTTLMLADQLISRLEYLHNHDYIHRDIKPDNFMMGKGKNSKTVFMIDFGLTKRYRDATTHEHIPFRNDKGMTGTVRYASINAHKGIEQSRRDDLEGIAYVLIYFIRGFLPWQGIRIDDRGAKFKAICDMKINTPLETLCEGIPQEFGLFLKYAKDLKFEQKPDYFYIKRLFRTIFLKNEFVLDFIYDWTIHPPPQKTPELTPRQDSTVASIHTTHRDGQNDSTLATPQTKVRKFGEFTPQEKQEFQQYILMQFQERENEREEAERKEQEKLAETEKKQKPKKSKKKTPKASPTSQKYTTSFN
ncbi:putative Casein kinase I [Blattamonas nauphoetae]|uniref:non-specific serine/threonine protein kinase n=1 Tax=Blattamonas nauphoetae TaxID=2049346 RepID=A0ABQ9YI85_9EUKA|nr:putative Casein kinase I [Blattamonas nauphoetae]